MKKLFLFGLVIVLFAACNNRVRYTQNSPEIDTFKKVIDDYVKYNWKDMVTHYADTAKILNNVTKKNAKSIAELITTDKENAKLFSWDFVDKEYEMVVTDKGETWVNFWGLWKGKLKSNNKLYEIPVHITARFVNGKIVRELGYWDVSNIARDFQKMEDTKNNMSANDKVIQSTLNNIVKAWNSKNINLFNANTSNKLVRNSNGNREIDNRKEYEGFMNAFYTAFPDFNVTINNTVIKGNKAYINWTVTGTNTGKFNGNTATNKKIRTHGLSIWSFNSNSKAIKEDAYYDNLVLFKQLGYTIPKSEKQL